MTGPRVDDWDPTTPAAGAALPPPPPGATVYPSAAAWVEDWWVPTIRRPDMTWCPHWWAHPEAVARLGALWAAWETANTEGGTAPSAWWVYHCDAHTATLLAPRGPFGACTNGHRQPAPPVPTEPLPVEVTNDA